MIETDAITYIGKTDWRNCQIKFGIKNKDRSGHMYVIGKTGTGKSTMLKSMAVSDIFNGYGICVIDPHGDLATELLDYVPESRIKDVIYFNPSDSSHFIPFNPLYDVPAEQQQIVCIITNLNVLDLYLS